MNIGMTVHGAKEVERMLDRLEKKETARVCRKETRNAQKPMMSEIKANAMAMVGGSMGSAIAQNLAIRAMTKLQRGHYGHKIIIKPTELFVHESKQGVRSYIPNAIEYGHAAPGDAGGVKITAPNPSQRKAYENMRLAVISLAARNISSGIINAARIK